MARAPSSVTVTGVPGERLPAPVEAAIYHVVSEALTNTAEHAVASEAAVSLAVDAARVHVEIADDGCGGADLAAGTGVRGLVDRVEALGGELTLESPAPAGTTLRAVLPLP